MSKIAGIKYNDTANAPGVCVSVYLSGCEFHCKNCHNPETWDFDYGEDFDELKLTQIIDGLRANGVHRNLCILGGEPMHQKNLAATKKLIMRTRAKYNDVKIYVWTGYTLEELLKRSTDEDDVTYVLSSINCLIDGPYIDSLRDITLQMRGSKNQRICWLNECEEEYEVI